MSDHMQTEFSSNFISIPATCHRSLRRACVDYCSSHCNKLKELGIFKFVKTFIAIAAWDNAVRTGFTCSPHRPYLAGGIAGSNSSASETYSPQNNGVRGRRAARGSWTQGPAICCLDAPRQRCKAHTLLGNPRALRATGCSSSRSPQRICSSCKLHVMRFQHRKGFRVYGRASPWSYQHDLPSTHLSPTSWANTIRVHTELPQEADVSLLLCYCYQNICVILVCVHLKFIFLEVI